MKKHLLERTTWFYSVVVFAWAGQVSHAAEGKLLRPLISKSSECGCHIGLPGKQGGVTDYYFATEDQPAGKAKATVNIGGKDVTISCKHSGNLSGKLNSSYSINCTTKDYKLALNLKVTTQCPPNDDGCEVTHRSGTLKVSEGDRSESMPVYGECGC